MSRYTIERCRRRAEIAVEGDGGNTERLIREHEEAAASATDPEVARIARGFAAIASRRLGEEAWRAEAYRRLADGEEVLDIDAEAFFRGAYVDSQAILYGIAEDRDRLRRLVELVRDHLVPIVEMDDDANNPSEDLYLVLHEVKTILDEQRVSMVGDRAEKLR